MAIVLEVSLTLNPVNQIAYLADFTSLVDGTEYVISATYLQTDTRFTFHGNLDITLTKPPQGVPGPGTVVPAEITTVPMAATPPPPVTYPYSIKERLDASNLNATFEFDPAIVPPHSALGGAGKFKFWVDTSTTPPTLRQSVVARAATVYNAAEWVTLGTVDVSGFKLGCAGGTLTGPLTLSGAPTLPLHATTKAYVDTFAPLASPVFTGDPRAPTPATADNDTSIATTAYVKAQGYVTGGPYLPLTGGTVNGSVNTVLDLTAQRNMSVAGTSFLNATDTGPLAVTGNATVSGLLTAGQVHAGAFISDDGIQYPSYGLTSPATNIGFGFSYTNNSLWFVANGSTVGFITYSASDERLKRDIRPITVDPLAALCRVGLRSFNQLSIRNDPNDGVRPHDVGFIAQQLREIIPDAVVEPPEMEHAYLGIDLMPLVAYCVGAIQQLAKRLE